MSSKVPTDAFKKLMESRVSGVNQNSSSSNLGRGTKRPAGSGSDPAHKNTRWKKGLQDSLNDPKNVVLSTTSLVAIKDKYPKAKFHFLIMPKDCQLNSAKELGKSNLTLLKEMDASAQKLINDLNTHIPFRIGFHARPSMDHLHLHVISNDFISTCLKTKRHWNSFNTPHFLELKDIIKRLEDKGEIDDFPSEEDIDIFLNLPLRCNQCSFEAKTIPALKGHLDSHAPASSLV